MRVAEAGVERALPVRSVRIHLPGGVTHTRTSIPCPAKDHAVSLSTCAGCHRCETLSVTPWSDQDFIVCRPETSSVPPSGTIADEMTNPVICVAPEVPLAEVGRLFIDQDIGGAPVVDPDGRPIGMVSRLDIVRTLGSEGEAGGRDAGDMTAGDVMTPVVFTLPETTPMTRAAALMAHDYLHRLPVVDKDGVVVGIVTSSDFLRWMGDRYGL